MIKEAKTIDMPLKELKEILALIYDIRRMNVIEVKDVSFQSSAFSINNLSFSIPQGFVTGFIGANGAGKQR